MKKIPRAVPDDFSGHCVRALFFFVQFGHRCSPTPPPSAMPVQRTVAFRRTRRWNGCCRERDAIALDATSPDATPMRAAFPARQLQRNRLTCESILDELRALRRMRPQLLWRRLHVIALCADRDCAPRSGYRSLVAQNFVYVLRVNAFPPSSYFLDRASTQMNMEDQIANGPKVPGGLSPMRTTSISPRRISPIVYRKAHGAAAATAPEQVFQAATFRT